jgi:NAD-dependent DNA ligase
MATKEKKPKRLTEKPITHEKDGLSYCFTGIRSELCEIALEKMGARVISGVSSKTTHLVCKDLDGYSQKMRDAEEIGVKLISIDDLQKELGVVEEK